MRLDRYLVDEGYFESRNRATEAIKNGIVLVDGKKAKPSSKIDANTTVEVQKSKFYVSRAGRKLESFLDEHPIELENKKVLDIGSSTGGFAQILLEHGVSKLDCVDVGSDQLHISLRDKPQLHLYEETDIREFEPSSEYDVITCDVSFISILQIIETIDTLASKDTDIIILYKPQFEVGKDVKRDSKGVVVDIDAINKTKERFEQKAKELGWDQIYTSLSKVTGKEGNQEFLYHFKKI
jgi:23S rRNA (cytidine1920-2'-O)/16S rRNA (cytidine1409-2'-O)-methyltransferase